jgi:glutaredoxin
MRISYSRKTNLKVEEIIENFKKFAKENNLEIIGIENYKDPNLTIINFSLPKIFEKIKNLNNEALVLIPKNIFILDNEKERVVEILNPEIINNFIDENILQDLEGFYYNLVNFSSGVGERKIEKIKLFATTTCPYCKKEKDFLDSNGIKYEYLLVDINPIALQEMVEKTGQMGVPVTEIIYEDGDYDLIIGFDQKRLSKILKI